MRSEEAGPTKFSSGRTLEGFVFNPSSKKETVETNQSRFESRELDPFDATLESWRREG